MNASPEPKRALLIGTSGESGDRPTTEILAGSRQADDRLVAVVGKHDLGASGQQVEDRRGGSYAGVGCAR